MTSVVVRIAIGALLLSACSSPAPPETPLARNVSGQAALSDSTSAVASITVVTRRTVLHPGDTVTFAATARDSLENALPARASRWQPADPGIVIVSPDGRAVAVAAGTTILTVEAGGHLEYLPITVSQPTPPIRIRPGEDIQAAVRRAADGATFLLLAGVHRRQTVVPRDGMRFTGEPGAILDGENVTPFAFRADSANNVRVSHLTVQHYKSPAQDGAIHADGGSGWVIDSCDISHNATGGIHLGHRTAVLDSRINDNGQIGILGGGDGILIAGNEIARNNPRAAFDMYWEAGGSKFTRTRDLIVRGNFAHHNGGPGLWTDIDNVRTLYEDNRVEDNAEAGIFHEISYAAVIRRNTVSRNGAKAVPPTAMTGSGILISVSSDVEVYGNTVTGNHNGITAIQDQRERGAFGEHMLRNLDVHDNVITMRDGATGIVTRGIRRFADRATYQSMGNRFRANTYILGRNPSYFQWRNSARTAAQWRAFGQDSAGRFTR